MRLTANAYLDARNLAKVEGCVTIFREAERIGHIRYDRESLGLVTIQDGAAVATWLRQRETSILAGIPQAGEPTS